MEPFSSEVLWIVVVAFILSFLLAIGVGANDVANSFGTSVGSGAVSLRLACVLATIFEIAGAVLIGYKVSETVRKGIIDIELYENSETVLMLGSLAALGGSAIWNLLATFLSMPISGTHTIVGATIGFSLVARGMEGVTWSTIGKIVGSWFISPVLSGAFSAGLFLAVRHLVLRNKDPLRSGLIALPLFYGFTVFVNIFSVLHDGPKLLLLNDLPLWVVSLASLAIGCLVAAIIQIFLVPRLRQTSKEIEPNNTGQMAMVSQPENTIENGASDKSDDQTVKKASSITTKPDQGGGEVEEDSAAISRLFASLQVMTASFGSFAHGGNDVSNAIGPLVAVWLIFSDGTIVQKSETPVYILFYGGVGISVGLWIWGRRVIKTIGKDLTDVTTSSGFTIELGAAFTVLMASKIGLPISTTHCKVGSVVFVGWTKSTSSGVDWKIFRNIVLAWLVTVPFAAASSAAIMAVLLKVAV